MIIGPPDTLFEGGYFKCHQHIPREYPLKPPELRILTEIWHPNIDKNGKVCISILHEPGQITVSFLCNLEWSSIPLMWIWIHIVGGRPLGSGSASFMQCSSKFLDFKISDLDLQAWF